MRYIIPVLFILLFDFLAYQVVKIAFDQTAPVLQLIALTTLLLTSVAAIGLLVFIINSDSMSKKSIFFTPFKSTIQGVYIGKFFMLISWFFLELIRMLINFFNNFINTPVLGTSEFTARLAIIFGVLLFSILIYGILRNRHRYQIFREEIKIPGLSNALVGLKIIQISDIHAGSFTSHQPIEKAIQLINKEAADLVFFTGDLVNNVANEMLPYIDTFKKIQSKLGVFSILGNHDYGDYVRWPSLEMKKENFHQLLQIHQQLNWQLLQNENRLINLDDATLAIIGVENYSANARFTRYGDLEKASLGSETADLKILLSHDPTHWSYEVVNKFKDITLTLSGHTHGGQFGIEITGVFKWSPVQYFYKKWAGLYNKDDQYLYVNRGFGYLGYPGRVGILPEITVIKLTN